MCAWSFKSGETAPCALANLSRELAHSAGGFQICRNKGVSSLLPSCSLSPSQSLVPQQTRSPVADRSAAESRGRWALLLLLQEGAGGTLSLEGWEKAVTHC